MPTSTLIYFLILLTGFALQYHCDSRCIADTARQVHLSVASIRWSPRALFTMSKERRYRVRILDQHGRVETRLCCVTGMIGLPMEATIERNDPSLRRR